MKEQPDSWPGLEPGRPERELERVHRRELADLLGLAAQAVRRPRDGAYASLLPPVPSGWRHRALRCLALQQRDGLDLTGSALLVDLIGGRTIEPELLVALAQELWPRPERLLTWGQVLLRRDEPEAARRVYAEAVTLDDSPQLAWRAREGLAAAWEALGKDRLALGCLAVTLDLPGVGIGPLASALFLGFEVGDRRRAASAADRLDARLGAGSRRLRACARDLAARRRRLRHGLWAPAPGAAALFTRLHRSPGAAGRLCRAFVDPEAA